jgi:hypothetical protein
MKIEEKTIAKGFILAGLMNASVLIFSRFFSNKTITEFDPEVMSNFGLLMIFIWGLAYISVAKSYKEVKWLIAIFAIEKFIYGFIWTNWILNNSVSEVFEKDAMAGAFYSIYGINDWIFCVFFIMVFLNLNKTKG